MDAFKSAVIITESLSLTLYISDFIHNFILLFIYLFIIIYYYYCCFFVLHIHSDGKKIEKRSTDWANPATVLSAL